MVALESDATASVIEESTMPLCCCVKYREVSSMAALKSDVTVLFRIKENKKTFFYR